MFSRFLISFRKKNPICLHESVHALYDCPPWPKVTKTLQSYGIRRLTGLLSKIPQEAGPNCADLVFVACKGTREFSLVCTTPRAARSEVLSDRRIIHYGRCKIIAKTFTHRSDTARSTVECRPSYLQNIAHHCLVHNRHCFARLGREHLLLWV